MSRKVIMKSKKAKFTLQQEGFSIHTFEIARRVNPSDFNKITEYLYQRNKQLKECIIYPDKKQQIHKCTLYCDNGIRLRLEHKTREEMGNYYIRMIVNPRRLIDPDSSYLGILEPTDETLDELKDAFRELFQETPIEKDIDKYYLYRVDQCVNMQCDKNKIYRELVRVMRKGPAPSRLERKIYQDKDKKKANRYNKHYIRFSCKSYEIVIYDKTYQTNEEKLDIGYEKRKEGILRCEIQYRRSKIRTMEKSLGNDNPTELLWEYMQQSGEDILRQLEKCYPKTYYYSYDVLTEMIDVSRYSDMNKSEMLDLCGALRKLQSIDKAIKTLELDEKQAQKCLKRFKKLGASPIPLRKDFALNELPSITILLEQLGNNEDVLFKYQEKKYK